VILARLLCWSLEDMRCDHLSIKKKNHNGVGGLSPFWTVSGSNLFRCAKMDPDPKMLKENKYTGTFFLYFRLTVFLKWKSTNRIKISRKRKVIFSSRSDPDSVLVVNVSNLDPVKRSESDRIRAATLSGTCCVYLHYRYLKQNVRKAEARNNITTQARAKLKYANNYL
jgi:hypothetical protein